MKTHYSVADLPLRHAAARGYDGAGYFVAQNLRRRNVGVENLLDVGAANATGGNFDEDSAVGHLGDGDFFDANDSLFAVDTSAHGLGDEAKRLHSFQSCAGPAHRAAIS